MATKNVLMSGRASSCQQCFQLRTHLAVVEAADPGASGFAVNSFMWDPPFEGIGGTLSMPHRHARTTRGNNHNTNLRNIHRLTSQRYVLSCGRAIMACQLAVSVRQRPGWHVARPCGTSTSQVGSRHMFFVFLGVSMDSNVRSGIPNLLPAFCSQREKQKGK